MKKIFFILFTLTIVLTACNKDDDVVPVVANAGDDQTVLPLNTVVLDGSNSSGPNELLYSWTYLGSVPESDLNLEGANSAQPSFIPPMTGEYKFKLTVLAGGIESTDEVTILAVGAISIGGTLESNTILTDINDNPNQPDYIIESDLIVPEGVKLEIQKNVVVLIDEDKGIIVEGLLTNALDDESYYENIEFYAKNGWKGILVDGGSIDLAETTIENAGYSAFEGQNEPAALTFNSSSSKILHFFRNEFQNSNNIDILVKAIAYSYQSAGMNIYSAPVPIKAPISFLGQIWGQDVYPTSYDYIHLIPSDVSVGDILPDEEYFFFDRAKYYFDGSFRALNKVYSAGGSIFYIKENSSLIFEDYTSLGSNSGELALITGLNGAHWNGIAVTSDESLKLNNVLLSNAGAGPVVGGAINSQVKAAVYVQGKGQGWIKNSTLKDIDGYGFYMDSNEDAYSAFSIGDSHFENISIAGIRVNAASAPSLIRSGITTDLDDNVPGCIIEQNGSPAFRFWEAIENSFYLIDAVIDFRSSGGVIFKPGVHLKFKSGRSLQWVVDGFYDPFVTFDVNGEADNPVIFEGETDEAGSWGGLLLEGYYSINYLQIKNGGEFILPGASTLANVFYDVSSPGPSEQWRAFTNSTVSGSDGYGIVKSADSFAYDFEADDRNNIFSNNSLGNSIQE